MEMKKTFNTRIDYGIGFIMLLTGYICLVLLFNGGEYGVLVNWLS